MRKLIFKRTLKSDHNGVKTWHKIDYKKYDKQTFAGSFGLNL